MWQHVKIAATGQIELLPSKKVEVTAPIRGKLVQLLVQPGAKVKAGQILATLSSPELNEFRVNSLEKRSEAAASLQQAQTDRTLAQQTYRKIVEVATAETKQAQSQLTAAQARLAREQQLVNNGSIIPAVGIIGGGAFWLGRSSNRVTTSLVDFVESEDEVKDLPASEILALEEATEGRIHSESESVKIDR